MLTMLPGTEGFGRCRGRTKVPSRETLDATSIPMHRGDWTSPRSGQIITLAANGASSEQRVLHCRKLGLQRLFACSVYSTSPDLETIDSDRRDRASCIVAVSRTEQFATGTSINHHTPLPSSGCESIGAPTSLGRTKTLAALTLHLARAAWTFTSPEHAISPSFNQAHIPLLAVTHRRPFNQSTHPEAWVGGLYRPLR